MFEFLEHRKVLLVYTPLTIYWLALIIGTSLPTVSVPSVALGDKLVHFIAYLILSVLLNLALIYQTKSIFLKANHTISALVISSAYGILDEFHQGFIPGRSQDIFDWVADTIGAIAGVVIILYLKKKFGFYPK